MGKRYLLDSNTVIDYIAGLYSDKATQWLNQLIDDEIVVSVITKIEVLSFDPDKDDNYSILVDFFEVSTILELSDQGGKGSRRFVAGTGSERNTAIGQPDAI